MMDHHFHVGKLLITTATRTGPVEPGRLNTISVGLIDPIVRSWIHLPSEQNRKHLNKQIYGPQRTT